MEEDKNISLLNFIKLCTDTNISQVNIMVFCYEEIKKAEDSRDILDAFRNWTPDLYRDYHIIIHEALIKAFEIGYQKGKEAQADQIKHILKIDKNH